MVATPKYVEVSISDHIARVLLNRPPVNALNRSLVAELTETAQVLSKNKKVWVVALTGTDRIFSAGADLKERAAMDKSQVARTVRNIQRMVLAWISIPQPVVAGVRGAALGGGLELALAADILVASDTALLGFPEVSLGIIPAAAGTQRLSQRSTLGAANKWVLTGLRFDAAIGLRDGVVDFVFPRTAFTREFDRIISQLTACAPLALRQAKKALNARYRDGLLRGLRAETTYYTRLIPTLDRMEALRAFAAKRAPVWRGK